MKKVTFYLASFLIASSLLVTPRAVEAQSVDATADSEIIKTLDRNCSSVRVAIKNIHTNDALTRVNVGQRYNSISTKLMARLNGRLAINKLDSSKLVNITNEFESTRLKFNSNYNDYDTAMTDLQRANCSNNVADYYQKLTVAREARNKLSEDVKILDELLVRYKEEVQAIKFRSYKFATFIGLTIAVSVVLVSIAMFMYYKTDAYRLDLSRPEYASHRNQISKDADEKSHEFDAQGSVNKDTLKEFLGIYDKEVENVNKIKAFSNDVLSDKELSLSNN